MNERDRAPFPEIETEAPTRVRGSGSLKRPTESVELPRLELTIEREAGASASRVVVVDGDACRIGAHPSNDVVIEDPLVSRFHCQLARVAEGWRIVDMGSANGTFVSGLRVRDADLPRIDTRITLGDSILRVSQQTPQEHADLPLGPRFGRLLGGSLPMRKLFASITKVAQSDASILIEGESGTGKEMVAAEIVSRGARAEKPFVVVDCGAVSPNLIESELFGHVRGSFTGADRDRVGAFEEANGGTIFLDEIGELPLELQPKLLRALQMREIRRVGENKGRRVDVRVLSATNRRLEREVNRGRFREDLYFRLSVVRLGLPPLRERREDLPALVQLFLGEMDSEDHSALFDPQVLASLADYEWPGNVRELRNYVERSVVMETTTLPSPRTSRPPPPSLGDAPPDLDVAFTSAKEQLVMTFERRYLTALLSWAKGNVSLAARKAGMDRVYLHRLMTRHGLRE